MRSLWKLMFLFYVISFVKPDASIATNEDHRNKRQINSLPLVYPYGAIYKLITGISSPVPNIDVVNMAFVVNFQYQYSQFMNISELSQYYFLKEVTREQREADIMRRRDERLIFYHSVANLLETKGVNGIDCLLRAICEAAQYPVEEEGLVGEIMHILLTPDYGKTPFDDIDPEFEQSLSQFQDAATAGRQMFSCPSIYSGCPEGQGVLELVTTLQDQ